MITTATRTLQSVLFPISQLLTAAEHTAMDVSQILFEKQGDTRPELQSLWLVFLKSPRNAPVLSQCHSALAAVDPRCKGRLLPGAAPAPLGCAWHVFHTKAAGNQGAAAVPVLCHYMTCRQFLHQKHLLQTSIF